MSERGAKWRKWDLHIHTPASFHWNGKRFAQMDGAETISTLTAMIARMDAAGVAAFGVMDYWTFDGFIRLRDYVAANVPQPQWALFPGMELRVEAPVDFRLNIHVLLAPNLTVQQLANFKSTLRIGKEPLSDEALCNFGKQLDNGKLKQSGYNPEQMTDALYLEAGSRTAKVTRESFAAACALLPDGTCLVVMPYDTSDGLEKLDWKKHPGDDLFFLRSADFFETRSPKNVDNFLGRCTAANVSFLKDLKKAMNSDAKPVLSGSDAHRITDYGVFPSGRATWLKADATFDGLRQVTQEPLNRCYIGTRPPKLDYVNNNKTKFIDRVRIKRRQDSNEGIRWFDVDLPLSHDLVAIIGNKGQGKSALAESIGIAGNSRQSSHFSFLSPSHFRNPKDNLASKFVASIQWMTGSGSVAALDTGADPTQPELVKVIPQSFLEDICNQVGLPDEGDFDRELRKVIFSHVDEADRLGQVSMEALLEMRTFEAQRKQQAIRQEIRETNLAIVDVEEKMEAAFEATLRARLRQKEAELEAHRSVQPPAVERPSADATEEGAQTAAALETATAELDGLEAKATAVRLRLSVVTAQLAISERLGERITLLADLVAKLRTDIKADADELGLSSSALLIVKIDQTTLVAKHRELAVEQERLRSLLDVALPDSLPAALSKLRSVGDSIRERLDAPNKLYQTYLVKLNEWKTKEIEIIGSKTQPDSLNHLESEIAAQALLPEQLAQLIAKRQELAAAVHAVAAELIATYEKLYAPVQSFIAAKDVVRTNFDLRFSVSMVDSGFTDGFLGRISRGIAGSFYGVEDGGKRLREMVSRANLNSQEGVGTLLREVEVALASDVRQVPAKPARKFEIAKGKRGLVELYNFMYCLEWLAPRYGLRLGEKELHQLSPGERGTMLLVFYLMVDKGDIPLVIDQPEENLDNQTVFSLLVPCVRDAKERRQIIIVTHNPNLAVVCDAEQIVHARMSKGDGYEVIYRSGSIENPEINKAVIDVLEGTRAAFDDREGKYRPARD